MDGYEQLKLRNIEDKLNVLEADIKVLNIDSKLLHKKIGNVEDSVPEPTNPDAIIKSIKDGVKEMFRDEMININKRLEDNINKQIAKELAKKTEHYDRVSEKVSRVTSTLMDKIDVFDAGSAIYSVENDIAMLKHVLIKKGIVTKIEMKGKRKRHTERIE